MFLERARDLEQSFRFLLRVDLLHVCTDSYGVAACRSRST